MDINELTAWIPSIVSPDILISVKPSQIARQIAELLVQAEVLSEISDFQRVAFRSTDYCTDVSSELPTGMISEPRTSENPTNSTEIYQKVRRWYLVPRHSTESDSEQTLEDQDLGDKSAVCEEILQSVEKCLQDFANPDAPQLQPGEKFVQWIEDVVKYHNSHCLDLISLYHESKMNALAENIQRLVEYLDDEEFQSLASDLMYAICNEPEAIARQFMKVLVQSLQNHDSFETMLENVRHASDPTETLQELFDEMTLQKQTASELLTRFQSTFITQDTQPTGLETKSESVSNSSPRRLTQESKVEATPSLVSLSHAATGGRHTLDSKQIPIHPGVDSQVGLLAQTELAYTPMIQSPQPFSHQQPITSASSEILHTSHQPISVPVVDPQRQQALMNAYLEQRRIQEEEAGRLYETYSRYAAAHQTNRDSEERGIAAMPETDLTHLHMMNATYLTSLMNMRRTGDINQDEVEPVTISKPKFQSMM